jgi:hypothetical protein
MALPLPDMPAHNGTSTLLLKVAAPPCVPARCPTYIRRLLLLLPMACLACRVPAAAAATAAA